MKNLRSGVIAVAAAVLMLACSSGPSLEDYFQQMNQVSKTQTEKSNALQQAADEQMNAAADDAARVAIVQKFFSDNLALAKENLAEVQGMDVPDEVKQQHEDLLKSFETMVAVMQQGTDGAKNLTSMADLGTLMSDVQPQVDEATSQFQSACQDLQKVAKDNDVKTSLDCGS